MTTNRPTGQFTSLLSEAFAAVGELESALNEMSYLLDANEVLDELEDDEFRDKWERKMKRFRGHRIDGSELIPYV